MSIASGRRYTRILTAVLRICYKSTYIIYTGIGKSSNSKSSWYWTRLQVNVLPKFATGVSSCQLYNSILWVSLSICPVASHKPLSIYSPCMTVCICKAILYLERSRECLFLLTSVQNRASISNVSTLTHDCGLKPKISTPNVTRPLLPPPFCILATRSPANSYTPSFVVVRLARKLWKHRFAVETSIIDQTCRHTGMLNGNFSKF